MRLVSVSSERPQHQLSQRDEYLEGGELVPSVSVPSLTREPGRKERGCVWGKNKKTYSSQGFIIFSLPFLYVSSCRMRSRI